METSEMSFTLDTTLATHHYKIIHYIILSKSFVMCQLISTFASFFRKTIKTIAHKKTNSQFSRIINSKSTFRKNYG